MGVYMVCFSSGICVVFVATFLCTVVLSCFESCVSCISQDLRMISF